MQMVTRIFYVDRFVRYSANIVNSLEKMLSRRDDYELLFLGPTDKNSHWLSNQTISNSKKVWSRGKYVRSLYRYIKLNKADIIHISFELRTFGSLFSAVKFPLLLFLLGRTKTKVVVTLHNILAFKKNSAWMPVEDVPLSIPRFLVSILTRWFIRTICNQSDKIIVTTHAGKQGLVEYYGIDKEKIETIREGFMVSEMQIDDSKRKKFSDLFYDRNVILAFGVITPRKGLDNAINAFKLIHDKLPNHVLVIAGTTNPEFKYYEDMLHHLAKKLELEKKIIFTGFVDNDEVEILFDIAKIIVYVYLPSVAGSGSLSFAVQNGKPIVATKIDTFLEILGPDDALFVKPSDDKQLADAILEIATNEKLRLKLEQNVKKLANSRSWDDVAADHLTLYEKLLA